MNNSPDSGNDLQSLLRYGVLAGQAGRHAEARHWFQAALDRDTKNITALLWLAWLAPTRHESLELLGRVLELDSKHERARAGIRWARRHPFTEWEPPGKYPPGAKYPQGTEYGGARETAPPAGPESTPRTPTSTLPERSDLLEDAVQSPRAQESARSGISAQRARRLIGPLGLLLAVAAGALVTGVALLAQHSSGAVLARVLPSAPITVMPTLTSSTISPVIPTRGAAATSTVVRRQTPTPSPVSKSTSPSVPVTVPSAIVGEQKWIDVDLTHQQVTAYEGGTAVYQATASTGLAHTPTIVGEFRIYRKFRTTNMAGPGYYLRNVPYTMYFHRSYALHGTYWHDKFGQPMSHGCVNLRTEDARWLFDWTDPPLPSGASNVRSNESSPGTLVVVHH